MCSKPNNQGCRTIDHEFKENILQSLNALREGNSLCDVVLSVNGSDFPAHRCVLSASSSYFQALFSDDFREKRSGVVRLEAFDFIQMEKVLQFLYTGEVEIDLSNAQDLIMAADYLNIPSLKQNASAAMQRSIDVSNCLTLYKFSTKYGCALLKKSCDFYINQNFSHVSKSIAFRELDYESVIEFLRRDELNVNNEIEVFLSAISWVKYDLETREKILAEVLKYVRFPLIAKYELVEILKSEQFLLRNAVTLNVLLKTINDITEFYHVQKLQMPRTGPLETAIILSGGKSVSRQGLHNSFMAFLPLRDTWVTLPDLHLLRHGHGAAVCQGALYLVGGVDGNLSAYSHVCRFSLIDNKWKCDVADLPHPVSFSAVVSLQNKLFVIGGRDSCKEVIGKTQCYDPKLNQWDFISDMHFPRDNHCATVLGNSIYVISGNKCNYKSCECYDSLMNKWYILPDMIMPRQQPAAQAFNGKIFVAGGFSEANYRLYTTCEIYDPKENEWNLVSGLAVPRAGCAIACDKDCIYIFGGSNGRSILNTLDSVECYNAGEDKWQTVSVMPETVVSPQVSIARMPQKYLIA